MRSNTFTRISTLFLGALLCIGFLAASVTEEIPLGNLRGTLRMKENGKALKGGWVTLVYRGGGQEQDYTYRHYETEDDGTFDAPRLPAGAYEIEASTRAHAAKRRFVIIEEGKTLDLNLDLAPKQPELQIYASQRVFIPDEAPSFQIEGFDTSDKATVTYYKLDLAKIVEKGGLSSLLYSFSRPETPNGSNPSASSVSSEKLDKKLQKDAEGVFAQYINLPKLSKGFYYVTCGVGKQLKGTYLNVSTIGLVTKTAGNQALCFVSDLTSGTPISGASIMVPGSGGANVTAKTDSNGLARVQTKRGKDDDNSGLVVATYGDAQGVVDYYMEQGSSETIRMFMYTDRPIYRPGDTIQFKGIARRLNGLRYLVPSGGQVQLEVDDPGGTLIKRMTVPMSSFGSFNGSFSTNKEDAPGGYTLKATYAGKTEYEYVSVAAYRKPQYSIKVTPTQEYFVYGDKAAVKVKAEYYFGGPVIGAKLEGYISRNPHYAYMDEYEEEGEYYSDQPGASVLGEFSQQVELVTDEKGEALVEFDTRTEGDPVAADSDLDYTVMVSMTDESGQYFDASGDAKVVRGSVSAEIETDHYIAEPGSTIKASVTVLDQGNDKPVANHKVTVVSGTERWAGKEAQFHPKQTFTGTTNDKGIAVLDVPVKDEGVLVLKATVNDNQGRPVLSEAYVYVEGDSPYGGEQSQFTLTLDKKAYAVGDVCKGLIQTDKPGGSALVTVQAERVLATYVVKLDKPATMFKIPVSKDYSPNVWVSAVAIKDKKLRESASRLVVNVQDHDLKISVTPDKASYQPGDRANLTIKTTDANGRPVPADLSLGVVDESIYAIKEDNLDLKDAFYPMRPNSVRTNYSFEEIYLDGGDKGGGDIPVRSKFLDTATWMPTVQTDASGTARTTVQLPDNLTSWRATVVGVTGSTQVGVTKTNFVATKPLTIRLQLPAFLVQQDTQEISATITNDTGKDQDVNVRLDVQGISVDGATGTKIHVTDARPQTIRWTVKTPQSGEARLTAYAWTDGGDKDAEERTVGVQPHGRKQVDTKAAELKDGTSATFTVSTSADKNIGGLKLTIEPSIGSSIIESLDALIDFPYGCTEQTMSRFLPAVVLSSALKDRNIRTDLAAKIPEIVEQGFARLSKMQHQDGSWGWWEYDEGDEFMTAYVLHGLKLAEKSGYTTNKINRQSALQWARQRLSATLPEYVSMRDRLYLAYALALYGVKDDVKALLAKTRPSAGSEVALIALTQNLLGDATARDKAIAGLHDHAKVEGQLVKMDPLPYEYGAENLAFPLIALTEVAPKDPLIPQIVRTMMVSRRGGGWYSTRDTSFALIGLTQYMQLSNDMGKPVDVEVSVNGGTWKTVRFDPAAVLGNGLTLNFPISELRQGDNRVDFQVKGHASPGYYSGELTQVVLADTLTPIRPSTDLNLSRAYYLLEPQRVENGKMELRPSKRSIEEARAGDLIRVELTISSGQDREYLMVEDPIPSGCRITEREYIQESEQWSYWWSQIVVRDDRAAFFMRYMPKGIQKLTYTMRAEQVGVGHALPPSLSNMYDPNQFVSGGESVLKVTP